MTSEEIVKIERYLRRRMGHAGFTIEAGARKDSSAEDSIDGEFVGVIFKDTEDGEVSYDFHMTILAEDLR